MTLLAILSLIVGAGLALCFNASVLIPATLVMLTAVATMGVIQGDSLTIIIIWMMVIAAILQVGFLLGIPISWYLETPKQPSDEIRQ